MKQEDISMHLSNKQEAKEEENPIPSRPTFSSEEDVYEKWKEGLGTNQEAIAGDNEPSGNALPHIEKD